MESVFMFRGGGGGEDGPGGGEGRGVLRGKEAER